MGCTEVISLRRFPEKLLLCSSGHAQMSLQACERHRSARGPIMAIPHATLDSLPLPSPAPMAALRLAASTMTGPTRRACAAEMTLQDGGGHPLMAAAVLGWGRQTVALGVAERRPGLLGRGAPSACSGRTRWEERQPQVAAALRQLADAPAPQAPTLRTSLTSTRLTAQAALAARRAQG